MIKVTKSLFDYKITLCSSLLEKPHLEKKKSKNLSIPVDSFSSSFYRAKSKILDYAKNNIFNYMITITIDSSKININDISKIKDKILKYFNNYKTRKDKEFRYIIVPELGGKNKRLHFHGLIYCSSELDLTKHSSNSRSSKTNKIVGTYYRNEWLFKNIGANQWKKISDYNIKCANYISKYITKSEYILSKIYSCSYFCSNGLNTSKLIIKDLSSLSEPCVYGLKSDSDFIKIVVPYLAKNNLFVSYQFCECCVIDFETFSKIIYYSDNLEGGVK